MDWRSKIREIGLRQTAIATLLGRHKSTVSQDLAGDPPASVRAIIAAWEIMSPEQRAAWLAALDIRIVRFARSV